MTVQTTRVWAHENRLETNPGTHVGDAYNSGSASWCERRLLCMGYWRLSKSRRAHSPEWRVCADWVVDADIQIQRLWGSLFPRSSESMQKFGLRKFQSGTFSRVFKCLKILWNISKSYSRSCAIFKTISTLTIFYRREPTFSRGWDDRRLLIQRLWRLDRSDLKRAVQRRLCFQENWAKLVESFSFYLNSGLAFFQSSFSLLPSSVL